MYVKKVIVDWDALYNHSATLRILFYDPDGNLIEVGTPVG